MNATSLSVSVLTGSRMVIGCCFRCHLDDSWKSFCLFARYDLIVEKASNRLFGV
jgi:hypothetical protein